MQALSPEVHGAGNEQDFQQRQDMTPYPTVCASALNDVRNAIFQRLGTSPVMAAARRIKQAVNGLNLGVDLRGNTMNGFLGIKVLTELLIMGRMGVYVDSPTVPGNATLADVKNYRPYLYFYPIEDILSWTCSKPDEPSTFQACCCGTWCSISINAPTCRRRPSSVSACCGSTATPARSTCNSWTRRAIHRPRGKSGRGRGVGVDPHPLRVAGHRRLDD